MRGRFLMTATAERPPCGLDARWLGVWRHAIRTLKEQGTWKWEQQPLLAEYVYALRAADDAREGFRWLDALEDRAGEPPDFQALLRIASGLPNVWDKHVRRASMLADQLALTDRGRKAIGILAAEEEPAESPFAGLDEAPPDEIGARRRARGA
jgi:hypothetical protein